MISLGPTDNSSEIGQKYGLVFLGEWNANLYFFTAFSMRLLSLTKAQTAFSRFAQFWRFKMFERGLTDKSLANRQK